MRHIWQKTIAVYLICALLYLGAPRQAHAIIVEDIIQDIFAGIDEVFQGLQTNSILALEIKEYILDTALYIIKEEFISSITNNIREWAATGFQGSPHFIEDPEEFFTGIGTEASGVFLSEVGAEIAGDPNFFCSGLAIPKFMLDIGIAGRQDYRHRARCTIDQAINNVQNFYDNFQNGSWDTFFKIQQRQNNQFGEYSIGLHELYSRQQIADERFRLPVTTGGGFLPSVDCPPDQKVIVENADGSEYTLCKKWMTKTPAKAISDRVTSYIQNDINRVIPGDEIGEIIAGIVVALVQGSLQNLANSN